MKRMSTALAVATAILASACGDDSSTTEPTRFRVTIENLTVGDSYSASGVFNTPVGEAEPGPLFPGGAYEFSFYAAPGQRLSFATMMVQSNDWFYAPAPEGIALFDDGGAPLSGDITSMINLYDAGTEADEPAGEGVHQAPRQDGANMGPADSDTNVRPVTASGLPGVSDVIAVTITPMAGNGFTVRIENISTADTLQITGGSVPVPLAPGSFVVHGAGEPLFSTGTTATTGLEALAEDGDPSGVHTRLDAMTQIATPFAPGVFAVDTGANVLFSADAPASVAGLEMLAEDGDPSTLLASIETTTMSSGVFDTPAGGSGPGPAFPGGSYEFEIEAEAGDKLHFATMFVQSNDWFIAPDVNGINLFDANGTPLSGEVSDIYIWDAGTETDEAIGAGPNQAPRQAGANTGAAENGNVRMVTPNGFVPSVAETVRVTITPIN